MREERLTRLTARKHWGRYALGMLTEIALVLTLMAIAFIIAVLAKALF